MKKTQFLSLIKSPFKFQLFLLTKIPTALISGVKIKTVNDAKAVITIKFSYWNKNPFKSMYFACLSMAAEMATGILAMLHCCDTNISLLVLDLSADFQKKAIGNITFICDEGKQIKAAIEKAKENLEEGSTVKVKTIGTNEKGEVVAIFNFTWTFKMKSIH